MDSVFIWALVAVAAVSAQNVKVSTNARCGIQNNKNTLICTGSAFGNCCSQYGWCGTAPAYCGNGCNPAYGTCTNVSPVRSTTVRSTTLRTSVRSTSVSVSAPSASSPVSALTQSTNARCGFAFGASPGGRTCAGTKWGNCCSQYSYCGSTEAYCGVGCQPGFGTCNVASSSSVRSPTISSSSVRASSSSVASAPSMIIISEPVTSSIQQSSSLAVSSSEPPASSASSSEAIPSMSFRPKFIRSETTTFSVPTPSSTLAASSSAITSSSVASAISSTVTSSSDPLSSTAPASSSIGPSSSSSIFSTDAATSTSVSSTEPASSTSSSISIQSSSTIIPPSASTSSDISISSTGPSSTIISSSAIPTPSAVCGVNLIPVNTRIQTGFLSSYVSDLSRCRQLCLDSPQCMFVVYQVGYNSPTTCILYDNAISHYGPLDPVHSGTFLYERGCFATSSSTSASSIAPSTSSYISTQSSTPVSSDVSSSSSASTEASSSTLDSSSTVASSASSEPVSSTAASSSFDILSTSAAVATSSEIVASTAAPSPSSSDAASASSAVIPSSSSTPLVEFCVKVITPGHPWFGVIPRNAGPGQAIGMLGPASGKIASFILQPDGKLTLAGNPVVIYRPVSDTSALVRPVLQSSIDADPQSYSQPLYCSISSSNTLKCTASSPRYIYISFTKDGIQGALKMTTTFGVISDKNELADFGVFYGADCVSDGVPSTPSAIPSSSVTPSTSVSDTASPSSSLNENVSSTALVSISEVVSTASSAVSSSDVASSTVAPTSSSDIPSASLSATSSSEIASASSTAQSSSETASSPQPVVTPSDVASASSSVVPASSEIISSVSSEMVASNTQAPSSSEIISSTSSDVPSTSDAVSSSSVEPSATISSSDISSSIEPSATSSEAASSSVVVEQPPCYTLQPNYVKNPGFVYQPEFDTSMGYWRLAQDGPAWSDRSWVWAGAGRYDNNGFQGSTYSGATGKSTSKLTLIQDNIALPDGAQVDVKVDFNQRRKLSSATEPFSAVLRLDDNVIATYTAADNPSRRKWVTLGNSASDRPTITGNSLHTIALEVTTGGVANEVIFWADNFSITVVQAPNICPV